MDWIKRNLSFVIGGVVALVLLGLAGWYFYSKLQLNNEKLDKLNEQYAKLDTLNKQNPHPGNDKVHNIQAAKDQQQQLRAFIRKSREYFQRIPPIPDSHKVNSQEFSSSLSRVIDQLQHDAANNSVTLPPKYNFSFEAQRQGLSFASGSLEPLSVQLGEVKTICDALFQARINSLDNLRRERVSADDKDGPQTDYLDQKSVTNELAILSPYEVTFRCFSPELAAALGGFASSSSGLLVKTINVEPAPALNGTESGALALASGQQPGAASPPPASGVLPAAAGRGGLPTVLDERLLRVTLTLDVVKMVAPK